MGDFTIWISLKTPSEIWIESYKLIRVFWCAFLMRLAWALELNFRWVEINFILHVLHVFTVQRCIYVVYHGN